jgi:hypothetical protein
MTVLVKNVRSILGHLWPPHARQFTEHRCHLLSVRFRTRSQIKTWRRQQESPRPRALGIGLAGAQSGLVRIPLTAPPGINLYPVKVGPAAVLTVGAATTPIHNDVRAAVAHHGTDNPRACFLVGS